MKTCWCRKALLAAGSLLQSLLTQHPQAECWLGRTKLLAWSVMEAKLTSRSLERSFYQTLNRTDRFTMIQGQNGDVLAICWFSSRTLPAESLPVRCSWCTLLSMVWTFKKAFSRPGSSYCTQASTVTRWHHASYLQGTSSPEEMWRMVKLRSNRSLAVHESMGKMNVLEASPAPKLGYLLAS